MSLPIDFSTLVGVAAVNVFVTEAIVSKCKVTKEWAKQLISWITPLVLSVAGLLCQLGLFADYGVITDWHAWIYTILTGVGLGLVSNGLYDIPFVQTILDWIVKLFEKKKKLSPVLEEFPIAEGRYAVIECEKEAPCEDPEPMFAEVGGLKRYEIDETGEDPDYHDLKCVEPEISQAKATTKKKQTKHTPRKKTEKK